MRKDEKTYLKRSRLARLALTKARESIDQGGSDDGAVTTDWLAEQIVGKALSMETANLIASKYAIANAILRNLAKMGYLIREAEYGDLRKYRITWSGIAAIEEEVCHA